MPQMVFNTPNLRNFYGYAKIGLFIPFFGQSYADARVIDNRGDLLFFLADGIIDGLGGSIGAVDELFLNNQLASALGYSAELTASVDVDLKAAANVVGWTGAVGGRYQINDRVSVFGEFRVAGFNINTQRLTITELDASLEINNPLAVTLLGAVFGVPNLDNINITLTENGGASDIPIPGFTHAEGDVPVQLPDGSFEIPRSNLESLIVTEFSDEITENSNNLINPNGVDGTKPGEDLPLRKTTFSLGLNVGVQINLAKKK